MAKATKATKPFRLADGEVELRRWCIEQAIRWPEHNPPYGAAIGSVGGGYRPIEADIISRANRLLNWVNGNS